MPPPTMLQVVGPNHPAVRATSKNGGSKRKPRASKGLTNVIKGVISREIQTKYVSNFLQTPDYNGVTGSILGPSFTGFSSGITSTGEIYGCLPHTAQGLDDHQRVGDTIAPIGCKVVLDLTFNDQTDQLSIDRTIHVFMLQAVAVKTLGNYTAIPITTMLDEGTGINVDFNGTKARSMCPVDKSSFRVLHHKQFRQFKPFGRPNGVTGTNPTNTDSVLSISSSYRRVTMNVKLPAKLKYDTKNAIYPENAAPFLVIGWTTNDATGPASSAIDLQVMGTTHLWYKDA